ncbi:MAG: cupin domain-containing protein [Candidatus Omnitrophica bacterium]|nr:cupin domain-containing protein [Candidatus Omnitrophota bacterium]
MTAKDIIERLGLKPHPKEGGFFREIYRADESISRCLPNRYGANARCFSTAIYYLLTPETFSRMHRLKSDEVFHFYLGDPVKMLRLFDDGHSHTVILGNDLDKGFEPQVVVPKGVWQGAMLMEGGAFALLGTTVAPGFEYEDYHEGVREELISGYPDQKALITRLTK